MTVRTPACTKPQMCSEIPPGTRPPRISKPHSMLSSMARLVKLALPTRANSLSTMMNLVWSAAPGGRLAGGQTTRRKGNSPKTSSPPWYARLSILRSRTKVTSTPLVASIFAMHRKYYDRERWRSWPGAVHVGRSSKKMDDNRRCQPTGIHDTRRPGPHQIDPTLATNVFNRAACPGQATGNVLGLAVSRHSSTCLQASRISLEPRYGAQVLDCFSSSG